MEFLDEIKLRGMKDQKEEIIHLSTPAAKFIKSLQHCELCKENYPVHQMTFEDAFYDTEFFMENLFTLHDVPTLDTEGNQKNLKIKYINPLNLTIFSHKNDQSIFSGSVYELLSSKINPSVLFRGIILTDNIFETTSGVYSHELTHTELDSVKGSIEYYKHREVISILVEAIHFLELGEEERMLRLYDCYRIFEMIDSITGLEKKSTSLQDKTEMTQFLISDLKSYNVFMSYYYGNDKIKQEIINWIQKIFDAEITVEEFLFHFDSLEDSSYDAVKLKKYFSR